MGFCDKPRPAGRVPPNPTSNEAIRRITDYLRLPALWRYLYPFFRSQVVLGPSSHCGRRRDRNLLTSGSSGRIVKANLAVDVDGVRVLSLFA